MKKRFRFSLSTTQIIMLSFIAVIFTGSFLLSLPFASANGTPVRYIDALFTATTSTCVTGLVTLPTVSTWSLFGQIVILCLIQIGGLGVITVMAGVMVALNRKMKIGDRLLIQDSFNLNTMSELGAFIKKVMIGTFSIEAIGALLYMTVFVKDLGIRGIWISIFNSISAFCNAGIDIIAEDSLCSYATDPLINAVTSSLIILGGIGYIVWWDMIRVLKESRNRRGKWFRYLTLHSKIALTSTTVLIFAGALVIFIFEYNNPLTLKDLSLFDKIQVSLFQSITTRTAGFATIPQQYLTNASSIVCIVLMFIGGSPVGTAGGIKTVTATVLIASAIASLKNKNDATLFNRNLSKQAISKSIAVVGMSFVIVFLSTVMLCTVTEASALTVMYETVSATATVGLSKDLTPYLSDIGKLIITATMYLGRVGPISLAIAFNLKKGNQNTIKAPTEDISVG